MRGDFSRERATVISERTDFIERLRELAASRDSEESIKSARSLFEEYVRAAADFYARQDHAHDRVQSDVSKLRDSLAGETNQHHPGRLGILIDFMYEVVADWLNPRRSGAT